MTLPHMPDTTTESPDDYCAAEVRRYDPDRWLTALFVPDALRPGLLALYAFNSEIARAREVITQPMIGQIRLQWWREAWEGIAQDRPRQHPVVLALHRHCRQASMEDVRTLIDARERDMDPAPMADMAALLEYAEATSAPLMRLAAMHLGATLTDDSRQAIAAAGTAHALTGLLRATPHLARQGRVYLPVDQLAAAGIVPESVHQGDHDAAVQAVVRAVAEAARARHRQVRGRLWDPALLRAMLPAVFARLYLKALAASDHDPVAAEARVGPLRRQMAVLGAVWRRRL